MTSKQRAYLKGLAMNRETVVRIGKAGLTPEITAAAEEALRARELIKVDVLKSCTEDERELARTLSERTRSLVVQVIGRKIVLYRQNGDESKRRIELPS